MIVMGLLYAIIRHMRPKLVNDVFGKLQIVSATYMGWRTGWRMARNDGDHGTGLLRGDEACDLKNLPGWLSFLSTPEFEIKRG